MEFLADDSIAGQTLLRLVARGSAIVAELLRLSDHIPSVFLGTDHAEAQRYSSILLDFRYLKSSEMYDEKIDSNADLVDLDEEFRENNLDLLGRFYKLFDSVHRYYQDLSTYIDEMNEGVFVQYTIESVLLDDDGKQLLPEALYLYGVMLLLLDLRIPGQAREQMIVSYYRYKGAGHFSNIDEICKLCRATGYQPNAATEKERRPPGYPEQYFERFNFPKAVVEMVIGRLRSDDIYNRSSAYPSPAHRSTALATQSAMLYVLLFFQPDILHNKQAVMREIVDKHFPDNWMLPFYMGFTVDLHEAWEAYKAAKAALGNIVQKEVVQDLTATHSRALPQLISQLESYLVKGVLVEEYVLNNLRKLMAHVRECNVTLRWLLLHRSVAHKKFRELILKSHSIDDLLKLLMKAAQFEYEIKEILQTLINEKELRWNECKKEASDRMSELSRYFSGEMALTRVQKNEKMQSWFSELSQEISSLDYNNATVAGRKIAKLIQALENVEEFHQVENDIQVQQFLKDTRTYLHRMVKTVNIKPKMLGDVDIVADFSYAWELIGSHTELIHQKIKHDPSIVLLLRATFLKLTSILELPLVRITQCQSHDEISVAEYYSSRLVNYIRNVLDVIPASVFSVLDLITQMITQKLKPVPMKLERQDLKEYAQLAERYTLAKATHQVSVFTEGILAMETTRVGVVKLDPKGLLEDGLRKQLVQQICMAMHQHLVFSAGTVEDFEHRIIALGNRLDGFRLSIEYIQDYVNMYGLKIWQEELSRIMNYYVEQESNGFLKRKVYDWQSKYQSDAIPIPPFRPVVVKLAGVEPSINFTGRLVRELLRLTHPRSTVFVECQQGWYDPTGKEVAGIRTFDLLNRAIGVVGLTGVDKLVCFMIVRDLHSFVKSYRRGVDQSTKNFLHNLTMELSPVTQFPPDPTRLYAIALQTTSKLWPRFQDHVVAIGQAQLVRRQISNELNFSCKMDSKLLSCALDNMNKALLADIRAHYAKPDKKPYPSDELLTKLTNYLEHAGFSDPTTKIYITTEPLDHLSLLMFLFVLSCVGRLAWNSKLGTLICTAKNDSLDGAPLVVGVITVLKQFHHVHTESFLALMGQYIRSTINASAKNKSAAPGVFPLEAINSLLFLEEFCKFSSVSRAAVEAHVPSYIFDRFRV